MKALFMALACLTVTTTAFASSPDYQCIADKLQAINSDIWYELSPHDINVMLTIPEFQGHIEAVRASKQCDAENIHYSCVSDSLQAINSDIWYNLSRAEIDSMLRDSNAIGHNEALRAANRCGLR